MAVSISLTIIVLLMQIYLILKDNERYFQTIYQTIQQANVLISLLKNEIKIANRFGCEKLSPQDLYYDGVTQQFKLRVPIIFSNNGIQLSHTDAHYSLLLTQGKNYIVTTKQLTIQKNDFLVVSDCIHTELVKVESVSFKAENQYVYLTHNLYYSFAKDTLIAKLLNIDISFKNKVVYLSVNHLKTPIARHIENLIFTRKTIDAIQFQFDTSINKFTKHWYAYAASR